MQFFRRKSSAADAPRTEPDERLGDASSAAALQELLDGLPDCAGVIDAQGRVVRSNAALQALLGNLQGRTLLEATRSADLEELAAQARRGAPPAQRELLLPSHARTVLGTFSPLAGGRALMVLRDLTESKRGDAVRRDFIANASHELRTPVAAIGLAAETLLGGSLVLEPSARGFVEMIARHADRLTRLTQDLLDLSRIESGEYRLELGPIDVAELCEDLIELVRPRAEAKQIILAADAPATLRVLADRRALEQILVNFLDNAIKFTPQGGRVTLLADGSGAAVVLSVLDTGPGIEPRHLARLFERFYRVDPGRSREMGGTGLGLAIAKHLAQAQGGTVGAESGRGGSRFFARLPAAR